MNGPLTRASLHGFELVVFDKDGTLIEFDAMWGDWMLELAGRLEAAAGPSIRKPLFAAMGFDASAGQAVPHGGLAATPMSILRGVVADALAAAGLGPEAVEAAIARSWRPPDPVATARPLGNLPALFEAIRSAGACVAVATSDDREPTERTLRALGVASLIDGLACADDGLPVKPAPDMVRHLGRLLRVDPPRIAVVGDSPADLAMGRTAGAGLVVGVLSGVGARRDLEPLADVIVPSIADLSPG